MLEEDRRDVPVGHLVASNRDVPDDMGIGLEEALPLGDGPHVGQREQHRDVAKCGIDGRPMVEYIRVNFWDNLVRARSVIWRIACNG